MNDLDKYISEHSSPEDGLLHELDRQTNLRVIQPRMISGHIQGLLLKMIVGMVRPRRIIEIGTFTGYSALCMAAGLPESGTLDTFEVDDELEGFARSFFDRSPHGHKITQHIGSALEIAPTLDRIYDLAFLDGDKREYTEYYRMLMGDTPYNKPMMRSGSVILADNILWYGKVAHEASIKDSQTINIQRFNNMILADKRVENIILPIRDGLNLIRVK